MTFPTGSPQGYGGYPSQQQHPPGAGQGQGYSGQVPQQPPGQPGPYQGTQQFAPVGPARPNPLSVIGIPSLCALGVLVLALVSYFISFSESGQAVNTQVSILLAGGLLCGLRAAPKAPAAMLAVGAVLSVVGGLSMLAVVVRASSVPTSIVLILVFCILQFLLAIAAYLFDSGIIKLPPPGARGGYGPQQVPAWEPSHMPYGAPNHQPQHGYAQPMPPQAPQGQPSTPSGGVPGPQG